MVTLRLVKNFRGWRLTTKIMKLNQPRKFLRIRYHICKGGWDAPLDLVLYYEQEIRNHGDPCAVAVKKLLSELDASLIQFCFRWSRIATNSSVLSS